MSNLLSQASLVMIPSGYKEDVVYSAVPTNGNGDLSFTRASNGTRVNSAGLVEVCPWNLLQQSETFNNAIWNKRSGVTITADSTTAPNGTTTADTANYSSGDGYIWQDLTLLPSTQYTISVYAKGSSGSIQFNAFWGTGTSVGSTITLTSDWQRLTFTFTTGSTTSVGDFGFFITATCNIWGAQLNIGSTAKPYFPTTDRLNVPRLTYQNGGGGCPSLLLEKQSTNLATYSEQFDNAGWTKNPNVSITANNTTSPDGTQNADKMTNSGSSNVQIYQLFSTSTALYTTTIYAKKGTNKYFGISLTSGGGAGDRYVVYFDLDSGSVHQVFNTATPLTNTSNSIQSVGNGWYRCVISADCNGQVYAVYQCTNNGTLSLATNGDLTNATNGDTYIWGAQAEASSYPTSYIPTTSSSATRVADACSKTGISSLIGASEGVLFTDFVCNGFQDYGTPLCVNDGTVNNSIWLTTFGNGTLRGEVFGSGSVQASFSMSGGVVGQRYKMALAYKANDFAMYINGTQIGTDSSGSVPSSLSRVDYDYANPSAFALSLLQINQSVLFPTRLTNAELASLTTI